MSVRRCATCGKEFEQRFGDTTLTLNCPSCDAQQREAEQAPLVQTAGAAASPSFPITIALIAVNALVFAVMVLRGVSALNPTPQQASLSERTSVRSLSVGSGGAWSPACSCTSESFTLASTCGACGTWAARPRLSSGASLIF